MILRLFILTLFVAVAIRAQEPAAGTPPLPPELSSAQARWTEARSEGQTLAEQRRTQAKNAYLTELANFEKRFSASGDLDGALAVRGEKERIEKGQETTVDFRRSMPPDLRSWRDKYETTTRLIDGEQAKTDQSAKTKYVQDLQALEVSLTKGGQLEAAMAARNERSRLTASPVQTPKPAPAAGTETAVPLAGNPANGAPLSGKSPTPSSTKGAPPGEDLSAKVTAGSWHAVGKVGKIDFEPDGTMKASWSRGDGRWKATGPRTLEFTVGPFRREAKFTADFKTMTYETSDGKVTSKLQPR